MVISAALLPDTRLLPPPQQLTVVAHIAAKREEAGIAEASVSNRSAVLLHSWRWAAVRSSASGSGTS